MHYVGDIHQPLHATARVNDQYPAGDKGGNGFPIKNHYGAKNLHSVWDKVIYHDPKNFKTPLSESDWDKLGKEAKRIVGLFDDADLEKHAKVLNSQIWADESYEITKEYVYTDIKEGELPSEEYQRTRADIAERQVVLGGVRLANLLETIDFSRVELDHDDAEWMVKEEEEEEEEKKNQSISDMVQDLVNKAWNRYKGTPSNW